MRNPEFTDTAGNREDNSEINHEINPSRNEELGRAATAEIELARARQAEIARKQAELNKRQAELEEKLRALGADPDKIIAEARARELAKNQAQSAGSETAKESETAKDLDSNPEAPVLPPTPAEVGENAKEKSEKSGLRKVITAAAIVAATAVIGTAAYFGFKNFPTPASETKNETVTTAYAGETINGVKYDYTEYADREHKISYNAYGYNYEKDYNNRDATTESILKMAGKAPEALASYAYNIFTDAEKVELGIKDLTMVQNDDKFDIAGGGELQQKILDKFSQILKDKKNTRFEFYHENNTENTNYIYFVDKNNDGKYTPDELHLGYDTKKRNGAPQVDIYRTITLADGTTKEVKMLDLNMQCGYQPNYDTVPAGVPKITEEEPGPGTEDEPTPGTKDEDDPEPHKEKHTPKDEEEEKDHAGDGTPLGLDEKTTPKTTLKQDQENFKKIEQQKQEDKQKADEAKRVKEEQAKKEEAAKKEAANRENTSGTKEQQQQANSAKKAAEEQASREQAAKAEETKKTAEEQAAREKAQEAADKKATSDDKAAKSNNDNTAKERTNDFKSGNF